MNKIIRPRDPGQCARDLIPATQTTDITGKRFCCQSLTIGIDTQLTSFIHQTILRRRINGRKLKKMTLLPGTNHDIRDLCRHDLIGIPEPQFQMLVINMQRFITNIACKPEDKKSIISRRMIYGLTVDKNMQQRGTCNDYAHR